MVYFTESGQITLPMLSSEGKECLLAIHCEARRAQGDHRLASLKIFYRKSVDKKEKALAKNKVFIGYDYDSDKASRDRLLGWDANKEFAFSLYGRSFDVAIDSPVMFRNRACLSALFVQYSPALRVPPNC